MDKNLITKKTLSILLLLFVALVVKAQTTVVGKVSDQEGIEVIGATVYVKGKPAAGTVTDLDGKYKIAVSNPSQDILVFSSLGMKSQEVAIGGKSVIDIILKSDEVMLDEVVAIGYGTMKRTDISGSVSSVRGKEIGKMPVSSVSQALAGKIAGVQVTQSQGSPDAEIAIRVRGGVSITQNNEPLYIIDGFQSESGLQGLDPSDIENIDVLKDASATAIYGAAGANGVILITTKQAREGKPSISYDMYIGFKSLTKRLDLLNSQQFVELEYERAMIGNEDEKRNFLRRYVDPYDSSTGTVLEAMYAGYSQLSSIYGNRPGINWQDEVFKGNSPMSMNHKVGISGGTKTSSYNVSYSYNDDDGIMKNSGLTRNNIRGQFVQQMTPKMRMTFNVNYSEETTKGLGSLNEGGQFSRMQHIIQYRPIYERYKDDRELLNLQNDPIMEDDSGNQMQNPLISIDAEERERKNKILSLNGALNYSILNNLKYRGTLGLRRRTTSNDLFYHTASRQAINQGGPYAVLSSWEYDVIQFNNTLTWDKKFNKKHKVDVMIGQEYYDQKITYWNQTYKNFPEDNFGLDAIKLATEADLANTWIQANRKLSYFGRANYNYDDKYLATLTFRADGSTKFGKDNKWAYFPALSLAWRASEEDFIKKLNVFSDLKVRASYGTSGSENIPIYKTVAQLDAVNQPFNNAIENAYAKIQLGNPNLKWETNITTNLGLDMGFLDQRIQASIDIYQNETRNLLLLGKFPLFMGGYGSFWENAGKTQNRGIELSINSVNVQTNDFSWSTSLNISHNKNKVKSLSRADYFTSRSGWASTSEFNDDDYITRVGSAVGQMYGYQLEGRGFYEVSDFDYIEYSPGKFGYKLKENIPYDPTMYDPNNIANSKLLPGSWKFADTDQSDGEKGVINSKDKTVIGNANPDLIGGFINNFTYKGFDLSLGFTFKIGGDVYNANKMYFTKMNNRYRNSLKESASRFTYIDGTGANVLNDPSKLEAINQNAKMASINGSSNLVFHSGYVEDGSYLRLDNLTFGYTLPRKLVRKASINNLRVYVSSYNLFTIAGYDGFDPDVNVKPNNGLTPNIDWGAYPRSLSFVFGLNLTL